MRLSLWIASLWPGFVRAWVQGRWEGLVLAAAFAAALNTALVTTLVWRQRPAAGGTIAAIAWVWVLGLWALGMAWVRRDLPRLARCDGGETSPEHDALFREAQRLYLKGHWLEAETLVARLLDKQPADVEARLLLASIRWRTGRWNEAKKTLVELREEPAAARWLLEIEMDLRQIEELQPDPRKKQQAKAA
jgi:hypothetical protein